MAKGAGTAMKKNFVHFAVSKTAAEFLTDLLVKRNIDLVIEKAVNLKNEIGRAHV